MLASTSVDVDSPCNFQGVSSGPVWGVGVRMDGVVRSKNSCFMEDVTKDGARVSHSVVGVHLNEFAEAGMEIG